MPPVKAKKLVQIDVTIDTVCPWCYVGKKNLDKAMEASKGDYDFQIKWHPYLLDPNAPKKGMDKMEYYAIKFGRARLPGLISSMTKVYSDLGMTYKFSGLTGNTMDSHRLIAFAGRQGNDKQTAVVEELLRNYFTEEKYLGDKQVLLAAAENVGVQGAKEFLEDPKAGLKEIQDELRRHEGRFTGVPHYMINGRYELSGAQPPEAFAEAFKRATS